MLGLATIALGIVISATPVAVQGHHDVAQPIPAQSTPQKDPSRARSSEKREKPEKNAQAGRQESLRPPIGPRTTQGLAEDAISRSNR